MPADAIVHLEQHGRASVVLRGQGVLVRLVELLLTHRRLYLAFFAQERCQS